MSAVVLLTFSSLQEYIVVCPPKCSTHALQMKRMAKTKDLAYKILSNQGRETLELWWQIRKCHILCLKKVQPAVVFTLMPHS